VRSELVKRNFALVKYVPAGMTDDCGTDS